MSIEGFLAILLAINLLCAILAALLASRSGRDPFAWVLVCGVLGPFGLVAFFAARSSGDGPALRGPTSGKTRAGITVLLPVDGSEVSLAAVDHVVLQASGVAGVTVLTVLPMERAEAVNAEPGTARSQMVDQDIEEATGEARRRLDACGAPYAIETRFGDPASEILRVASEGSFDEIVIGRRGRGGVAKLLLGSVSDRVSKSADIPVTVVG